MFGFPEFFGPGYGASGLTIDTAGFTDSAIATRDYCKLFENSFDEYVGLLNTVSEIGFIEGEAADALRRYTKLISRFNNVVYSLGEQYQDTVNAFLSDIDSADGILYPRGFKGRRIYTDVMFRNLENAINNDFDTTYFNKINVKTSTTSPYVFGHKWNVKCMNFKITSLRIENIHKLRTLKTALRQIDLRYSQKLSRISDKLTDFANILNKFVEIIEPSTGKLDFPKMTELESLVELLEEPVIEIDGTEVYERIKYLLEKIHIGQHYFGSPIWVIRELLKKYRRRVAVDRILRLRRYWIMLLRRGFIGEYDIPKETIGMWRTEARDIANAISIGETRDWWGDEATPITIQYFVDVVGRIPALGTSISEFLAMLEDLYVQIRTAEKIKQDILCECKKDDEEPSGMEDIIEVSFNKVIIESITRVIPPHPRENPFADGSLLKRLLEQAQSNEWVQEEITSDEMVYAWDEECDQNLNDAVNEAQNTSEGAVEYYGVLDSVAKYIEESRQAKMNLFERLSRQASGDQKNYYDYCYNQLDSSTIFNSDFVEMMSLDEFLSVK